jgi:hypothetical protein
MKSNLKLFMGQLLRPRREGRAGSDKPEGGELGGDETVPL